MTAQEAIMILDTKVHLDCKIAEALGELEARCVATEALKKQIPKQVKEIHVDEYFCPACGSENNTNGAKVVGHKYCPECGQKLLANK